MSLKDPNTLGINKNIEKGFNTPPVKNSNNVNCIISIVKNINAGLLFSKLFLKKKLNINYLRLPVLLQNWLKYN